MCARENGNGWGGPICTEQLVRDPDGETTAVGGPWPGGPNGGGLPEAGVEGASLPPSKIYVEAFSAESPSHQGGGIKSTKKAQGSTKKKALKKRVNGKFSEKSAKNAKEVQNGTN